jgi:hypothetical protein
MLMRQVADVFGPGSAALDSPKMRQRPRFVR